MSPALAPFALAILAAGCATGEVPPPDDAHEAELDPGEDDDAFDGPRGRGGPIRRALEEADLSAEQRQKVGEILERPRRRHEEAREGHEAKRAAFVDAVRAGDVAAIESLRAEQGRMHAERTADLARTANDLHAVLTPEQRRTFVAALREGFERGPRGHGRGRRGEGPHLDRIARELGLTDDQVRRLRAARDAAGLGAEPDARGDEHRARIDALLTAFERDDFDASRVDLAGIGPGPMHGGRARMAREIQVLVPILTAEQREALADRIEERMERGPRGRGRGRGHGHGHGEPEEI